MITTITKCAYDCAQVALQFPDELLPDAQAVCDHLKQAVQSLLTERRADTGMEFFILADTSYGSCCVDETAAQHVSADALVHYGIACLSMYVDSPTVAAFWV